MKNWKLLLILLAAAAMLSLAFVACAAEAGEAETKTVYVNNTTTTTAANYSFNIVGIAVSGLDVVTNGNYHTENTTDFNPGTRVYPDGTNFVINGDLWKDWGGGWDASKDGSRAKGTIPISDGKGDVTFDTVTYAAGTFYADTKIAFTGNRNIGTKSAWDLNDATYDLGEGKIGYVLKKRVVNPGKPSGTGIISYVEAGNEKKDVTVNVPNASGDYIIRGVVTKKEKKDDIWIALFKAEKDFKDPSADTWTDNYPEFLYTEAEAKAKSDTSVDYQKLSVNAYEWTWFLTKK